VLKESSGGVNSSVIYLIHCKNFCKCHNVLPPSTIKKEKKKADGVLVAPIMGY
jgi:hypothetical protein